ncbi:helix-turn-helix transcriptional regulator [Salegentibacter sp. BDJ18]|uniref:helix-turn-helix domain-containing protein n=1 Tax=Salegentibacter sp. BDJ18 TaxID=2816376 RepID=UPI001AAF3589|nr:helix-turn-helix transcriptional regulator [Salegentibacter sp. BDJ18]MBO2546109.1 helix-turn-helix transcriptional regulator [Salegentibacter sp. BDJ18]
MGNYDNSVNVGKQLIFKFLKDRMKEKKISQFQLSEMISVNESTLVRNFKGDTEMLLSTYLKICGALELRPYLIPKEADDTKMNTMDFN